LEVPKFFIKIIVFACKIRNKLAKKRIIKQFLYHILRKNFQLLRKPINGLSFSNDCIIFACSMKTEDNK